MPSHERSNSPDDTWARHLALVKQIARGHLDDLPAMQPEEADAFIHFALDQHLAHFIVRRLELAGRNNTLPAGCFDRLQAEVMRRRAARDQLRKKLAEFHAALAKANVEHRVLKGIPFAHRYFGDVSLRRSADIDILVRQDHVDDALTVLVELGYRSAESPVPLNVGRPTLPASFIRRAHELTFEHEQFQIDLHWRLRTAPAYQWREAEIWGPKPTVRVDEYDYPVLSDEYALVLLLVSTAHDIARGGCRLKHLLDIDQLRRCPDVQWDWPAFLKHRQEEGTLGICVNLLRMVLDLWAESDEFPELLAAMKPYAAMQSRRSGRPDTIRLIRSPRGGVSNKLWFAGIYGFRFGRDIAWVIRRSLPHPLRWPAVLYALTRSAKDSAIRTIRGGAH